MTNYIDTYRDKIDALDSAILELIIERTNLASELVTYKRESNIPVYNPNREKAILDKLTVHNQKRISENALRFIFDKLFEESKKNASTNTHLTRNVWAEIINQKPLIISGPCSVESREQITSIAAELSKFGIKFLRGGSFKPRTSPDSFQGLGLDGIKYLKEAADKYDMFTVTEVMSKDQLINLYEYIDIVQIGSRMMNSFAFLKEVGQVTAQDKKPVLLKRGFASTIPEFLKAAEYIKNEGNPNILLCLRGIRTYEQIDSEFRYTADLASILELKLKTDLPVIFDPSHTAGDKKFVAKLSEAAIGLGADGLMIEVHNSPAEAMSDGKQSLLPEELFKLIQRLQ